MTDIDLIPADFRRNLVLRRQLRRFMLAGLLVLGGTAAARAALGYMIWREKAVVVQVEQRQVQLQSSQARTDELRQQRQVTEQQLAALEQLRGRDRVGVFLQALDSAYNEHVWFDSVHYTRRGSDGPSAGQSGSAVTEASAAAGTGPVSAGESQSAEMFGHAVTHSVLADFMQGLGAQSAVADLRLISTSSRSYTSVQVVDFTLSLQVAERSPVQP